MSIKPSVLTPVDRAQAVFARVQKAQKEARQKLKAKDAKTLEQNALTIPVKIGFYR